MSDPLADLQALRTGKPDPLADLAALRGASLAATAPPTDARSATLARHPEWDPAAGGGRMPGPITPTEPSDIHFADPEQGESFGAGFARPFRGIGHALMHPLDTLDAADDSMNNTLPLLMHAAQGGGISLDDLHRTPVGALTSPITGPVALGKRIYDRQAANQSTDDLVGEGAGTVALTAAPKILPFALRGARKAGSAAVGAAGGVADAILPETRAAGLVNRWLGKGAIDPILNKDAGRGIARAGIKEFTAEGTRASVKEAIREGQTFKADLLTTPAATIPAIDPNALLNDVFGNPPVNISKPTLKRWAYFANGMRARIQKMPTTNGLLTPAQVDQLKAAIDVEFGKLAADAPELNLNKKAADMYRALDRAVDQHVPGYREINSHLADLHHADATLRTKIAENATARGFLEKPLSTLTDPVRSMFQASSDTGTKWGVVPPYVRMAIAASRAKSPLLVNPATGAGLGGPAATASGAAIAAGAGRVGALGAAGPGLLAGGMPAPPAAPPQLPSGSGGPPALPPPAPPLLFKRSAGGPISEWPLLNGGMPENEKILEGYDTVQRMLPERFKNARAAMIGSPLRGTLLDAPNDEALYGVNPRTGHVDAERTADLTNLIMLSRKSVLPGNQQLTDVLPHELGHAAWFRDLSAQERNRWEAIYDKNLTEVRQRMAALGGIKPGMPEAEISRRMAAAAKGTPKAITEYWYREAEALRRDPHANRTASLEAFAELFAQYMANPRAFKSTYPREYDYFRELFDGREYMMRKSA